MEWPGAVLVCGDFPCDGVGLVSKHRVGLLPRIQPLPCRWHSFSVAFRDSHDCRFTYGDRFLFFREIFLDEVESVRRYDHS